MLETLDDLEGVLTLFFRRASDGLGHARVAHPVEGAGRGREQSTGDLVLPLGTGLKAGPALLETQLDGSVIADLEVQALEAGLTPPVSAIEMSTSLEGQSPGSYLVPIQRKDRDGEMGETLLSQGEELGLEIRMSVFLGHGISIEALESRPLRSLQIGPSKDLNLHAQLRRPPSLPADLLPPS